VKRSSFILGMFLLIVPLSAADFQATLKRIDRLHEVEDYSQCEAVIQASLPQTKSGSEKAELYWRLARALLNLGDEAEGKGITGGKLLAYFEQGQAEAQKAIEADPKNPLGYYWKAVNIGRWGQIQGILNALSKAKSMRDLLQQAVAVDPEHADSYYVLGQLYELVPGFPLSFGNKDYAVSLGRKSVDLLTKEVKTGKRKEINYDFYTQLAHHLWKRNYTADRRKQEQPKKLDRYESITDPMEKNCYYEAVVVLKDMSDRDEALKLVNWTIGELLRLPARTGRQDIDLEEARAALESWQ
jgi:tetratricopeptide (TPR) repeat protein